MFNIFSIMLLSLSYLIFIPPYTQMVYNPINTPDVIAAVLANPLVISMDFVA